MYIVYEYISIYIFFKQKEGQLNAPFFFYCSFRSVGHSPVACVVLARHVLNINIIYCLYWNTPRAEAAVYNTYTKLADTHAVFSNRLLNNRCPSVRVHRRIRGTRQILSVLYENPCVFDTTLL